MRLLLACVLGVLAVAAPIGGGYLTALLGIRPPWAWLLIGVAPLALALAFARALVAVLSGPPGTVRKVLAAAVLMLVAVALAGGLQVLGMAVHSAAGRESISARKAVCLSHVKNLTLAALEYADTHGGRLPAAETWSDDVRPYLRGEDVFTCSEAPELRCAYAYNAALSGVDLESIADPGDIVLIYESDGRWNAAGGIELLAGEPRHFGGDDYGFADGHAAWVHRSDVRPKEEGIESHLQWDVAVPAE